MCVVFQAILYIKGLDQSDMMALFPGQAAKDTISMEIKVQIREALLSMYNNLAAVHTKEGDWQKCVDKCDKV